MTDPNKVIVDKNYIIAYREYGSTGKWNVIEESDDERVENLILGDDQDETLLPQEEYEIGVFAKLDKENTGGKIKLVTSDFIVMTAAEQNQYLLKSFVKQTVSSWGGSIGGYSIERSGSNIRVNLLNSTNQNLITRIRYTAINIPEDASAGEEPIIISNTLTNTSGTLFTSVGSKVSRVTLPVGMTRTGVWNIRVIMEVDLEENGVSSTYIAFDETVDIVYNND